MKIYKIAYIVDFAKAYIIDRNNNIEEVETHIEGVMDKYKLYDGIADNFRNDFGEDIDWSKDYDTVIEYVKDFMLDEKIFCVVVDLGDKQVYVRPNLGARPSESQMKALSDWAIERDYKENIIVDVVVA